MTPITEELLVEQIAEEVAVKLDVSYMETLPHVTDTHVGDIVKALEELKNMMVDDISTDLADKIEGEQDVSSNRQ